MTEVQNFKLVTVIDYGIGAVELIGQRAREDTRKVTGNSVDRTN